VNDIITKLSKNINDANVLIKTITENDTYLKSIANFEIRLDTLKKSMEEKFRGLILEDLNKKLEDLKKDDEKMSKDLKTLKTLHDDETILQEECNKLIIEKKSLETKISNMTPILIHLKDSLITSENEIRDLESMITKLRTLRTLKEETNIKEYITENSELLNTELKLDINMDDYHRYGGKLAKNNKITKKELIAYCKKENIKIVKKNKETNKNVMKTKEELIATINRYKRKQSKTKK
jgi:hypothetical protein